MSYIRMHTQTPSYNCGFLLTRNIQFCKKKYILRYCAFQLAWNIWQCTKKKKNRPPHPISLGVVCCRVYLSTILRLFLHVPSELKSTVKTLQQTTPRQIGAVLYPLSFLFAHYQINAPSELQNTANSYIHIYKHVVIIKILTHTHAHTQVHTHTHTQSHHKLYTCALWTLL